MYSGEAKATQRRALIGQKYEDTASAMFRGSLESTAS